MFWTFRSCKECWALEEQHLELAVSEPGEEEEEEEVEESQPLEYPPPSPASRTLDTFPRKAPVHLDAVLMPAVDQSSEPVCLNSRMRHSSRRHISRQTRSMSSLLKREASHYDSPTPFSPELDEEGDQLWPSEPPVLTSSREVEVVGWDEMQRRISRNRRREKSTLKRIFTKQARV